jgi:DinB superfamily
MTSTDQMEHLKYPLGRFSPSSPLSPDERVRALRDLREAPARLRTAVDDLNQGQLDTAYRPGGWTVRQLVHHVADSHLNSYIRFKWATTEDKPTIKAYDEAAWAELSEACTAPVELSLVLLEALHDRWTLWLRSFTEHDWAKRLVHPATDEELSLDTMLQLYRWHGKHHVAHVTQLRIREGW